MYIKIVLSGIALFILFRIFSFLNKRLFTSGETRHYFTVILPIAELLTWFGFALWCIRLMYESNAFVMLITISVIVILLIIPSWFLIRDLIFGIILVIQRKIEMDTQIRIGNISGKVVKVGYFNFELKSKDGNINTIPYSKIKSEIIAKFSENIHLEKHLISFVIPATKDMNETVGQLFLILLNAPWVAVSQKPVIKNITREKDKYIIDVFVFVLKGDYIEKIREYVSLGLSQ